MSSDKSLRYLESATHSPGIYRGRHVVAYWPAWIAPSQERVDNICRLIEAGREFNSREEIEEELCEAGLLEKVQ